MTELGKLGRYQLRRVLGRGAMGVVYEGFDPNLNRRVAVKTILKSVALDEETERAYSARFVREAQAVGRLNHPHIVQVHDFGEENEVAYLVMEFIQGRELRSFLDARERFEPRETVRVMCELLEALDFAHEAGVVHRDVKPANIMLDGQRRVKLADFGVARLQDTAGATVDGTMVGTPAFMSPEQVKGMRVDGRTDIFSSGTILYLLLTGEAPFKGEGAWTLAKKIVHDDPPSPSSLVTNISPAFDDVIRKAMAKDPAQRYQKAREFAAALRGVFDEKVRVPVVAAEVPKKTVLPADAAPKASDTELEFWRALQNSNDPEEFEFYLRRFPDGVYSDLAKHKVGKLRAPAIANEAEKRAQHEAEAKAMREADERARREAELDARRKAEETARRGAEARARREAEEHARREAEAKARRTAEEQAVRAAALEKARRDTQEKEQLKRQEEARSRAIAPTKGTADVTGEAARTRDEAKKRPTVVTAVIAAVAIAGGVGVYMLFGRTPEPEPVVVQKPAPAAVDLPKMEQAEPAPPGPEVAAVDEERIRRETEERIRREYADKAAAEKATAAEKAAQEQAATAKVIAQKAAGDKAAAEKLAAEKAAAEKAEAERAAEAKKAAEKAAADKAMAEKAAAEKVAAAQKTALEKAAAEKAAIEKAAAAKAAAQKAAVARPGWPSPGDRWVYEVRELDRRGNKYQIAVEVRSASASGIVDVSSAPGMPSMVHTHRPGAHVIGMLPGIISFSPYVRAFQELSVGQRWSDIEYERLPRQGSMTITHSVSARVVGKEKIAVHAGVFDAVKMEVEISFGRLNRITCIYWYAESPKRFVKYQSRQVRGSSLEPEVDMELISYAPAGSR